MRSRAALRGLLCLVLAGLVSCTDPTSVVVRLPTTPSTVSTPGTSTAAAASTAPTTLAAATTSTSTASAATDSTATASAATPSGPALTALHALPIKGRAPKTGYSRGQFGTTWTDDVTVDGGHNGCDTRNDILRRDLTGVMLKARTQGCVAASGTLHDPYTGRTIAFVRGKNTSDDVQIDHVVALSDAWQTGAQNLTPGQRQDLANDPLELLAVDGPTNQSKGDGDAATWLPPDKSFRCAYVARQIAVKARYHLWVTAAERGAVEAVLGTCPAQTLPTGATTATPVIGR
ncbi:hypothetical protein ABIB25_002763 [Nakamurella sp. UYEF19]|uniref:HNH endonuclease family protein n=1 Tax=Nakamurella sp. UYEF19 TaxID=1756392 RepID=UPI00339A4499